LEHNIEYEGNQALRKLIVDLTYKNLSSSTPPRETKEYGINLAMQI